jgi:hypothetical protein
METRSRRLFLALLIVICLLGADTGKALPGGERVDVSWIVLAESGEVDPAPQVAGFSAIEFSEPLRRLFTVLVLAGIAFFLRRL